MARQAVGTKLNEEQRWRPPPQPVEDSERREETEMEAGEQHEG